MSSAYLLDAVEISNLHTSRRNFATGRMQFMRKDPRHSAATAYREWLADLPRLTGMSLTAIAKDLGMAASTLTRPLKPGDPGTSTGNARTIDRIISRYGVPPPQFFPDRKVPPRGLMEDAVPYAADAGDALTQALRALIGGRNNIDAWTLRTRSLELEGFMPGDVVLVDLSARPQPGDAVCAQVYDWARMKAETVMRVFESAGAINLLMTRTMDPGLQKPLVIDNERVVVKGVVLPHRLRAA